MLQGSLFCYELLEPTERERVAINFVLKVILGTNL